MVPRIRNVYQLPDGQMVVDCIWNEASRDNPNPEREPFYDTIRLPGIFSPDLADEGVISDAIYARREELLAEERSRNTVNEQLPHAVVAMVGEPLEWRGERLTPAQPAVDVIRPEMPARPIREPLELDPQKGKRDV